MTHTLRTMTPANRGLAILLGTTLLATGGWAQSALPGAWQEFERGGWHTDAKASSLASGGKRVSWFDNTARATYVSFDLAQPVPKAVLFVRYAVAGQGDGALGVSFGPADATTKPEAVPARAALRLRPTGSFDKYAWASLPLGDLPAGKHMLVVRCLANGAGAELDVAGLVADDPESRWVPPAVCKDGVLVGAGGLGAEPRPDDRADPAVIQAEAASIAERNRPFLSTEVPVLSNYRTSWLGNSEAIGGRGTGKWVQNQIFALHVRPDGTIYANSPWDEGGRECGIYKDGKVVGGLEKTHDVMAGYAIVSDGTHVYAAIKSGYVRRYTMDGKLAPFPGGERGGSDLPVGGQVQGPKGLSIMGEELFVAVQATGAPAAKPGAAATKPREPAASDCIRVYGLSDLRLRREWDLPRVRQLAADAGGTLWAIQARTREEKAAVVSCTTAGAPLPGRIDDLDDPSALAIDAQGRLLVAENGRDQQIRIYDVGGTASATPKLVGTFGVKGGVFAEPVGAMGADRFYGITALACDPAGNLYVNCNGWDWSGSDLRCFGVDGMLKWQLQGLFFVDCVDADPVDETQVFGVQERLEVDYDAPAGKGWRHVDYTLDPFRYPEDPRCNGAKGSSVRVHRVGGQRFISIGEMPGGRAILYRFDGRIAVPCIVFQHGQGKRKEGDWPPNAPDAACWLWRDANGDGRFDAGEFQVQPFKRDGIAGLFDVNGDYWQATWSEKIRHYPCKGLDANGVPQYDPEPAAVVDRPGDFKDMERIEYIPETDTMFISGYTERWPAKDQHFIPAGSVVAAYPRWKAGNRTAAWVTPVPYSQNPYAIPKSMSAAGDYVFVFYAGVEQVVVIDARDGKPAGRFIPGPEIGGTHGDADLPWAVKAIQRRDGSYAVFVEDDRYAKQVVYLWKP